MTEAAPEAIPLTSTPAAGETRNPFAEAGFRLWWVASVVAGTGVGIQTVTVPLYVKDRVSEDARGLAIAAALICAALPGALLGLFGGVVADRVERRKILVRTYLIAAAVSLAYVALAGADTNVIWPVFILAAVVGSAGAFTNPARQAMVPQLVKPPQIQNAAIFGTMAFMATLQFGGPALGGILADGPGLTTAFAIEVAMLALAALLFARIATDKPVPTGKSVGRDLVEGLKYVSGNRSLLGILALGTVPGCFYMGPFAVTNVLLVEDVFEVSDKFVGFLWAAFGAGIFAGSVLMSVIRVNRRGLLLCSSLIGGGIFLLLYGLAPSIGLALAALVVSGILGPAIFINYAVALLQENSEKAMMGRVMSVYGLSFQASAPVGYALAAGQVSLYGPQATIVASAAIIVSLGVIAVLFLKPVTRLA